MTKMPPPPPHVFIEEAFCSLNNGNRYNKIYRRDHEKISFIFYLFISDTKNF